MPLLRRVQIGLGDVAEAVVLGGRLDRVVAVDLRDGGGEVAVRGAKSPSVRASVAVSVAGTPSVRAGVPVPVCGRT